MVYKLATPKTKPTIDYDEIYLVRIIIHQDQKGVFDVQIRYRTFGYNANNEMVYSGDGLKTLNLKDFISFAQKRAIDGKPKLIQAFGALKEAVWEICAENEGTIVINV